MNSIAPPAAQVEQPVMLQLKQGTQRLHDETEHGDFNKALVMGRIPLEGYVEMLGQFLLVHRALEGHLRTHRAQLAAIEQVVTNEQFQEPYLLEDLAHFGRSPESIVPLVATRELIALIDECAVLEPLALLGIHYVFEGSNNGSRFIARALRRAYGLETMGLRYFDPYGEGQSALWQAFKQAMNDAGFTPAECTSIVRAACQTFAGIIRLHRELGEQFPAAVAAGRMAAPPVH